MFHSDFWSCLTEFCQGKYLKGFIFIFSWQSFLKKILMKSFWPLANFGILQRAPETSQGEILNKLGSCGVLNYMESIVWWVVNLKFLCHSPFWESDESMCVPAHTHTYTPLLILVHLIYYFACCFRNLQNFLNIFSKMSLFHACYVCFVLQ